MMWQRTDLKPADVRSAQLYDGFSILTLFWLEALGLCPVGESGVSSKAARASPATAPCR
jgi:hypothetical protein